MKATGIVRRLDDLGRLVIPKEIRKQYRLKEGDSIEFYIENEKIVLQKYELMSKQQNEILDMCATLEKMMNVPVFFYKEEAIHCHSALTKAFIERLAVYRPVTFHNEKIFEQDHNLYSGMIYPVVIEGFWQGSFIVLDEENKEIRCVEAFTQLLTRKFQA